jgi:acetamidase/formamidase
VKRIPRERALVYALDASLEPELTVDAAETFAIETEDASSGLLTSGDVPPTAENIPYVLHTPAKANPVGGPVFVNGVRPGRVRVDIVEIALAPSGVAYNRPALSPLEDSRSWPEGGEPFAVKVEHRDGEAVIADRLRWRLSAMIGTLACAPEWEVHSSSTGQGPWGGNLDVADFAAGASVYLNAYHEGGLVFAGDVHGCQGDGEYLGVADESRSEVVLRVSPEDGGPLPAPRVRTQEHVIALGIDKPLEAAAHGAMRHLMSWLVEDFGFSRRDAYLTVGLNSDFRLRVYQMTAIRDLRFVVGASLPADYVK